MFLPAGDRPLRNGLKDNEVQRRYAKAYESSYMTEQLAKLVMTVSTQVQKLRSRSLGERVGVRFGEWMGFLMFFFGFRMFSG